MNRLIIASLAVAALTIGVTGVSMANTSFHGATTATQAVTQGQHGTLVAEDDSNAGGDSQQAPKAGGDSSDEN